MLTSVAIQLVDVLEISKILVWKSASRFGDLRQGQALNRGLQRESNYVFLTGAGVQCLHYWQPFPRSSSNFTRAVHVHQPPYGACACKRGVGPCARSRGRGAPGPSIDRAEADQVRSAGARSPSSAGTPFAIRSGHLALF